MSRSVKIVLYGLLGGLVCSAVLRSQNAQVVLLAGAFVVGFLVVALLATFATKEKTS